MGIDNIVVDELTIVKIYLAPRPIVQSFPQIELHRERKLNLRNKLFTEIFHSIYHS